VSIESDIVFFERVPMLAVLGKPALRVLVIGAETRHLESDAVLFYAGDMLDGAYVVQQGSLQVERAVGEQGTVYVAGPGTMLGELALLTDAISPITATAREPTVLIRISRGLFHKMLEGYPIAAKRLRDNMADRVDRWTSDFLTVKKILDRDRRG
jgi:CRP-like cAMP-binding protein